MKVIYLTNPSSCKKNNSPGNGNWKWLFDISGNQPTLVTSWNVIYLYKCILLILGFLNLCHLTNVPCQTLYNSLKIRDDKFTLFDDSASQENVLTHSSFEYIFLTIFFIIFYRWMQYFKCSSRGKHFACNL